MKRLLILGGSILQLPAIIKAKEMGLYVGVVDMNPNCLGVSYADEFFTVSTIDENGVYEAAKQFKADGIMTLATDMPMRALAYACEKLSLIGIDYATAVKATDKGEMIKAFEINNVSHPEFYILNKDDQIENLNIHFPLITKPTDNSGSRGVMIVHNEQELKKAIAYSSSNGRNGNVIIEEYMQGPEVSVEVMVISGQPHILQITDKLTTGAPHFVEMGHSQPSMLSEEIKKAITELASKAVLTIGIKNGPAHVEIIVTSEGPKMVELGARMGGDCITTHLVPLSTGIDMVKMTIDIALGNKIEDISFVSHGSAIRYFDVPSGMIQSIENVDQAKLIPGIKEISFIKNVGDLTGSIGSSGDRIGFVIAQSDSPEHAIRICEEAINKIEIKVK